MTYCARCGRPLESTSPHRCTSVDEPVPTSTSPWERPTNPDTAIASRRRCVVGSCAAATVLLVAAGLAVVLTLLIRSSSGSAARDSGTVPRTSSTGTPSTETPSTGAARASPSSAAKRAGGAPVQGSPPSTGPSTSDDGLVSFSDSGGARPELAGAVVSVFDAYFGGINAGRYDVAWAQYTPRLQRHVGRNGWESGNRGSQISDVTLKTVGAHTAAPMPAVVLVRVRFVSRQPADLGPNGDTCDRWYLEETLRRSGASYHVDAVHPVDPDHPFRPCPPTSR